MTRAREVGDGPACRFAAAGPGPEVPAPARRPPRARRRRECFAVFLVVVVCSLVTAACTSARNTLGTSSSSCVDALPVAATAVGGRGSFAGVRLVNVTKLDRKVPAVTPTLRTLLQERAGRQLGNVCVVAYTGSFTLDQVQDPLGTAPAGGTGRYAIVVVQFPGNELLATFVRATEPFSFRHGGLGV